MDSFWGPISIYGCIMVIGLVIGAIGAGMADGENVSRDTKKVGNAIAMFGLTVMSVGVLPMAVHLIGNCIEKCF